MLTPPYSFVCASDLSESRYALFGPMLSAGNPPWGLFRACPSTPTGSRLASRKKRSAQANQILRPARPTRERAQPPPVGEHAPQQPPPLGPRYLHCYPGHRFSRKGCPQYLSNNLRIKSASRLRE